MTTAPPGPTLPARPAAADEAIPFPRLVAVEVRKMADTRAGRWLLIVIVVITVLAVGLVAWFAPEGERTFTTFMATTGTPQGFLLPVLGILLVTSEWGQRAALTTFTLVPHRGRIVAAKLVAAFLFGLAALIVALTVAALASLAVGGSDAWRGFTADDLLKYLLLQTLGLLQGVAFGMLFLNSAAAIVVYFVVPIAFSVVTGVVPALRDAQPWIDPGTAQAPLFGPDPLTGEQWAHLATTTALWVALPLALGALRVLRAEVK